MYTAEQLMTASSSGKHAAKSGRLYGVLTSEQMQQYGEKHGTITVIANRKLRMFFFTTDHCFGYPALDGSFVPSTMSFPMTVVPRPSVPDGVITTIEQWITVFESDSLQITTIEELVNLLNFKETDIDAAIKEIPKGELWGLIVSIDTKNPDFYQWGINSRIVTNGDSSRTQRILDEYGQEHFPQEDLDDFWEGWHQGFENAIYNIMRKRNAK